MLRAFDLHPATDSLVLWCTSCAGDMWLRIVDRSGRTIDESPPHVLPVHARWSPDGGALTYGTRIAFHRQDPGEPGTPKRVHLVRGGSGDAQGSTVALLNRSMGRQRFGRFRGRRTAAGSRCA